MKLEITKSETYSQVSFGDYLATVTRERVDGKSNQATDFAYDEELVDDDTDFDKTPIYVYRYEDENYAEWFATLEEAHARLDEYANTVYPEVLFDSEAGSLNLYMPEGYKSKALFLADKLGINDHRGNASISALIRQLIDDKIEALS